MSPGISITINRWSIIPTTYSGLDVIFEVDSDIFLDIDIAGIDRCTKNIKKRVKIG